MTEKKHSKKLDMNFEIVDGFYYFEDGEIYNPEEVKEILKLSDTADLAAIHKTKKLFKGYIAGVRKEKMVYNDKKQLY